MSEHSLPLMLTRLVGRDNELTEIARLLADPACRLLTLTGSGGIGKTRLALEVARQLTFPDGVYFVPLQPISFPDIIVPTIADSLKFHFYGEQDTRTQLLNYLRDKHLLLALDNFEHLLDGADLLPEILATAHGVKILVTTRERLHLREEWVFDVGGLAFPEHHHSTLLENYAAIHLFVENARRVGYVPKATDIPDIVRICQLVEGIPLAIELAAAWVRAISCAEIAREIAHSLDILTTTVRNFPEKHRSMRAAFAHSWTLLSEEEQTVFTKLSVFRGGFRREAAEAIAGASLMTLAALVDKSLLRVSANGRYDMHELLRQYGDEQLQASGAANSVRDSYSRYYLELLHQREPDIKGRRQLEVLDEIDADRENFFTAWRWGTEHDHAEGINKAIETLLIYAQTRTREQEAEVLFRQAQERFTVERYPRAWGQITARRIRLILFGPFVKSPPLRDDIERCLAIAEEYADSGEIAFCKRTLAASFRLDEDTHLHTDHGRTLLAEALTFYEETGDHYNIAPVLKSMGYSFASNAEASLGYMVRSLAVAREAGIANQLAWTLAELGPEHLRSGHYTDSQHACLEALDLLLALGDKKGQIYCLSNLSLTEFFAGEFARAQEHGEESLRIADRFGLVVPKVPGLTVLALLHTIPGRAAGGTPFQARKLSEEATSISTNNPWFRLSALVGRLVVAHALGDSQTAREEASKRLKESAVADWLPFSIVCMTIMAMLLADDGEHARAVELLGLTLNHPASPRGWFDHWPLLTRQCKQLQDQLGSDAYSAAFERGKQLTLDEVINALVGPLHPIATSAVHEVDQHSIEPLTEREREILQLLADGLNSREVAQQLYLSVGTIRWYMKNIYGKLNAHSRAQAIAYAKASKLLT